jgi:hypothetical protein
MRFPDPARLAARLTTLLVLSFLGTGCATNDLRGDDVPADPVHPDQVDSSTEQQYRDARARELQRQQKTAVSARPTVKPRSRP